MRILSPWRSHRADLPVEPATHLRAGRAGRELDHAEAIAVEQLELVEPASLVQPRILLAHGETEGQARPERGELGAIGVVVRRGVSDWVDPGLDVGQHLERRHELAAGPGR